MYVPPYVPPDAPLPPQTGHPSSAQAAPLLLPQTGLPSPVQAFLSRHTPGTSPLHRQPLSYCHKPSTRPLYKHSSPATNRTPVPCTSIPLPPQTGRPSPAQPLPCCHTPQRRCASLLTGSTPSSGCQAALTSAFSSHGLLFADFTIILTIIRYDNRQKLSCNPLRPI